MNTNKILIAYASRSGTTEEIACFIEKIFIELNFNVEIKPIKSVTDLKVYNAVIIGSAIQYDTWLPEVRQFIKNNLNTLTKLPVSFYFSCLTLSQQSQKTRLKALTYSNKLNSLFPQLKPVSVGQFAGVLNYSKLSFLYRFIFKAVMPILGVKEGDYRNWGAIKEWAEDVHSKLNNGSIDQIHVKKEEHKNV